VPTSRHEEIRKALQQQLGDEVELEIITDLESVYSEPDDPWIQRVFDIAEPYLGARPSPKVATYFTDAAALTPAYGNPPTLVLGPGEAQMAHQTDEYCIMERVKASVDLYQQVIADWCGV
jgi:succinyl-diaminopimelate desuccinylase